MTLTHETRPLRSALAGLAGAVTALAFHPDWIYDPLRYAELTQRGPVGVLLGPQHVLGNLLPFAAYRGARGLGYDDMRIRPRQRPVVGEHDVEGPVRERDLLGGGVDERELDPRLGHHRLARHCGGTHRHRHPGWKSLCLWITRFN